MTVTVSFKHEGEDAGVAFGRIVVIDEEEAAATDPNVKHSVSASGASVSSWPFGYRPDWLTESWGTITEARRIAEQNATELGES